VAYGTVEEHTAADKNTLFGLFIIFHAMGQYEGYL
jgi:hypothetical protein